MVEIWRPIQGLMTLLSQIQRELGYNTAPILKLL